MRVPIAKPAKKVAAPPPSSSMMLANLDLDRIEDTETHICPKCGVEVTAEDVECPECHVNLQTGLLSDQKKVELSRKGPNPKLYYKEFVRDGFDFWKREKRLTFRLATFWTLFCLIFAACAVHVAVVHQAAASRFLDVFGIHLALDPAGADVESAYDDHRRHDAEEKEARKIYVRQVSGCGPGVETDFLVPRHRGPGAHCGNRVPGAGVRGMPLGFMVAAALEGAAVLFASLLFPVAMTHMAMPITRRGWMLNKLSKPFFRTFPAVIYWCFFLYLTLLPAIACVAVGGFFAARGIPELLDHAAVNTRIFTAKAEIENIPKTRTSLTISRKPPN